MPTTLALPSGDKIQLADEQDEDEALSAVMGYAESEAERLNASAGALQEQLEQTESKLEELSSAKELLVDEVCRRKALAEDSFDASEDRNTVAALSVGELEEQLSALNPVESVENATGNEEPSGEGVYSFAN